VITALGDQRFRFNGPDGAICNPAPTISGDINDLTASKPEIAPDTIEPGWDGTPLHASAIAGYLSFWSQLLRRSRTATAKASELMSR
jgi:hypothetical protein